MTFPTWLVLVFTVTTAVIEYLQQQTGVSFSATVLVVMGAVQVAIAVVLGFQKQATRMVRGPR